MNPTIGIVFNRMKSKLKTKFSLDATAEKCLDEESFYREVIDADASLLEEFRELVKAEFGKTAAFKKGDKKESNISGQGK